MPSAGHLNGSGEGFLSGNEPHTTFISAICFSHFRQQINPPSLVVKRRLVLFKLQLRFLNIAGYAVLSLLYIGILIKIYVP